MSDKFYKILLLFFLGLQSSLLFAQQKLGDNLGNHIATKDLNMNGHMVINAGSLVIGKADVTNSSVALEIEGTNKAILVPRVTSLASVANPLDGMIVYSVAASENRFYLHQNGNWTTFATKQLPTGHIFVGNDQGQATARLVTGDISLSATGIATIRDSVITASKIADNAVSATHISSGAVETDHIGTAAVVGSKIANGAVSTVHIADGAVTSDKIADDAITPEKISTPAGSDKLLITDAEGVAIWVDKAKLLVPPMDNAEILVGQTDGTVLPVTLSGDATLTATGLATISDNTINSAKIADGSIEAEDIADNAITADKINATGLAAGRYLTSNATGDLVWESITLEDYAIGDIKAYFPHLMGDNIPFGWVECNGQVLNDPGSVLDTKTIPNLNDENSYLRGADTSPTSGNPVPATTGDLLLTQSQLPASIIEDNTTVSSAVSAGTPEGSIVIGSGGNHDHSIESRNHNHSIDFNGRESADGSGTLRATDRSEGRVLQNTSSERTNISVATATANHTHNATFNSNNIAITPHSHSLTTSSLNGSVAQVAIDKRPKSVTVRWIMKVK